MENVQQVLFVPRLPIRLRVAAYARVSSGKDAMLDSLANQVSYYNDLIQSHIEWEFVGIYADEAITGTKADRPEFLRLIGDCRHGLIDLVITKSISRFARNTMTTLSVVRELKELGIDIFFERENIHSISNDGEFMLTLLASYAQEESRSVSENIKWRIRKMYEEGRTKVGKLLGYRLVDGKLQIVPSEAVIVEQIFSDYLSGMGSVAIMNKLKGTGIILSRSGIKAILSNEKYMGDLVLQKLFTDNYMTKRCQVNVGQLPKYYVKDSHEAIVSKEVFAAVQSERKRRAAGLDYTPKVYVFTGRIHCGVCGRTFSHKINNANTKYATLNWRCNMFSNLSKSDCPKRAIPEWFLQQKVTEVLGLPKFDEEAFKSQITNITVYPGKMEFSFISGETRELAWQPPSTKDMWTPEKRQKARERKLEYWRHKNGD